MTTLILGNHWCSATPGGKRAFIMVLRMSGKALEEIPQIVSVDQHQRNIHNEMGQFSGQMIPAQCVHSLLLRMESDLNAKGHAEKNYWYTGAKLQRKVRAIVEDEHITSLI